MKSSRHSASISVGEGHWSVLDETETLSELTADSWHHSGGWREVSRLETLHPRAGVLLRIVSMWTVAGVTIRWKARC